MSNFHPVSMRTGMDDEHTLTHEKKTLLFSL